MELSTALAAANGIPTERLVVALLVAQSRVVQSPLATAQHEKVLSLSAESWYQLTTQFRESPMSSEESTVAVSVGNIHVDKAVVSTQPPMSNRETLLKLTPLLSVLITGIALITSSGLQVWQTHSDSTQKTEEDWRAALDKVADQEDPLVGSLEMQSFMTNPKYRDRSGSIIAVKLPKIPDAEEFDAAFAVMPDRIDKTNQDVLIHVARSISQDLQDHYNDDLKLLPEGQRTGKTLSGFLLNPDDFDLTATELNYVLTQTWKLDSTIRGLQRVWTRKDADSAVSPEGEDLSQIEFYGAGSTLDKAINFTGVSFKDADLGNSAFLGNCIVTDPSAKAVSQCVTPTPVAKK
jgi:hypothetical protein